MHWCRCITTVTMMKNIDYGLFTNCMLFWVAIYGIFVLLVELNYMHIVGAVLLYTILHYSLLPPPNDAFVNEVLGVNPRDRLRLLSDALSSDESSNKNYGQESKLFTIENVYPSIAHQAAGLDAPQNTLAAIKMCFDKGCRFIHIDVKLTADNIPILYSNDHLKQKWMEGVIYLENNIEEISWKDIKQDDISSQHPLREKFEGEKIATLEAAISLCLQLDMRLVINLVHLNYFQQFEAMVQAIINLYKKYPSLCKRAVLSSFNPFILYMIKRRNPDTIVALCWKPLLHYAQPYNCSISWLNTARYAGRVQKIIMQFLDFTVLWLISNIIYRILSISCIILQKDIITPNIIEQWEDKGVRVIASVVNLAIEKAYYTEAIGIAYLTDTLDNYS